jgi:WD40 repeat protein
VVRLWDLDQVLRDRESDKLTAIAHLEEHAKPIISLAFNPSGTLLATASGDNTIRLWGIS